MGTDKKILISELRADVVSRDDKRERFVIAGPHVYTTYMYVREEGV